MFKRISSNSANRCLMASEERGPRSPAYSGIVFSDVGSLAVACRSNEFIHGFAIDWTNVAPQEGGEGVEGGTKEILDIAVRIGRVKFALTKEPLVFVAQASMICLGLLSEYSCHHHRFYPPRMVICAVRIITDSSCKNIDLLILIP